MTKLFQYLAVSIVSMLCFIGGFRIYETLAVATTLFLLIDFVENFGKSIWLILDVIAILALLTWNIAPLLSYYYFDDQNYLAVLWDRVMKVNAETYYSYVFPGTFAMILGLKLPFISRLELKHPMNILRKNGDLHRPSLLGYQLIGVSIIATIAYPFVPVNLAFIFFLLIKLAFIGILYLFFSGERPKYYILFLASLIFLLISIRSGMFGDLIYMVTLGAIVVLLGTKYGLFTKSSVLVLALYLILIIQSLKGEYRKVAWRDGGDSRYFFSLAIKHIGNSELIASDQNLFNLSYRFNQGYLISLVMERVPRIEPYANGETIWLSILGSLVPRVLWPDKPKSGGAENMERFAGRNMGSTSMNISPIGEAWANFGHIGGVIFMFFYGAFLHYVFRYFIKLTYKIPTLIIWFPLLFFYVVVTESDILSVFNHLLKTSFFVAAMYLIFPIFSGNKL